MKTILTKCLTLMTSLSLVSPAMASSANTYAEGYIMGQISDFEITGVLFKSGEGKLLLGHESSQQNINPWPFSASTKNQNLISSLIGTQDQYVILKYRQINFSNPNHKSEYLVEDVKTVNQNLAPEVCQSNVTNNKAKYSDGSVAGRIVTISKKGLTELTKSWEIVFQAGNSGNQFISMSVLDKDMAPCLLNNLAAGKKVKLFYNKSLFFNPGARDTEYNVTRVEPIEKPQ